jgi:fatty-acyl-CoA synthase
MKFDIAAWGAEISPDRPAVCFNGRWHTYGDLNDRAIRLANRLAEMGVAPGDRVGIVALNHIAHIDLLFAAPKLGFVCVPFNGRLTATELRILATQTRPLFALADQRHFALTQEAFDCQIVQLADYREWLAYGSRQPIEPPPLSPDSVQMMLFTSGSTGRPRAAMITYGQQAANARGTAMGWELGAEDCAIQATPCFHAAFNVLTTPLLAIGGRVILMSQFEPGEYLRLLRSFGANLMFMVPSMYHALSDHAAFNATDFSKVRWAISGGAPCPVSVIRKYESVGIKFKQGYGLTEAGVNCFEISADEAAAKPDSVGRPLPHVEAAIRREDGTICDDYEIGELTLAGEAVCGGYFEQPQDWGEVFCDGWLWTGDLAERDARGLYFIRGRRKEMYITGGENVYPAEVEMALCQCPSVVEAAVISVPDGEHGEAGHAVVVPLPGMTLDQDALLASAAQRLARFKLPKTIEFVVTLPRTATGKVDKLELRRRYAEREAPVEEALAPDVN